MSKDKREPAEVALAGVPERHLGLVLGFLRALNEPASRQVPGIKPGDFLIGRKCEQWVGPIHRRKVGEVNQDMNLCLPEVCYEKGLSVFAQALAYASGLRVEQVSSNPADIWRFIAVELPPIRKALTVGVKRGIDSDRLLGRRRRR
jgi:hypothetical protein